MSGAKTVGDWSVPLNFPSLLGVHLAVNAISDAFVLVDGPDCSLYKAHFIHGRHDWNSTLLDVGGRHRVAFTNVCSRGVVKRHDEVISEQLRRLDALPQAGLIFATALPMCSITGVDYGRVIRGTAGLTKPAVDIPPGSLVGDWLDGYAQALAAAASLLEPRGKLRPGTAAVVGCLYDRNEGDHRGNVEELRKLCAAVDLELVSVLPSGEPFSAMRAACEAEFVVSLPYGRKAARLIAEKSGARLVEAELPFGLPRTEAFLTALGKAAGREDKARAYHEAQLRRVAPRLEWILPHVFLNKRAVFVGDPHLAGGFLDIAEDAGVRTEAVVVSGREAHGGGREGVTVLHEPPERSERVMRLLRGDADLVVSCWREVLSGEEGRGAPVMEFGFPSYRHHVLLERPFLGHDGFLAFLERMAEHLVSGRRRWDA